MALLASFQRKFDALECTVDITYSIRLNKKVWGRIMCRKNLAKYVSNQEVIKDISIVLRNI